MDLYLIRHAEAEAASADASDARRPLTRRGRRRFAREVKGLARLEIRFDLVLFSPLLRAQETADLLLARLDADSGVMSGLARRPDETLLHELRERVAGSAALVGHEPWLSQLATRLLVSGEDANRTPNRLRLEKGGVVHLSGEIADGAMTLMACYPPLVLRRLGRR